MLNGAEAQGSDVVETAPSMAGTSSRELPQRANRILLVNTADIGGGAERSAWTLFKAYTARGHRSWLAVGTKRSDDPNVLVIANERSRSRWSRMWWDAAAYVEARAGKLRGAYRLCSLARCIGDPRRWLDIERGHEDFHFPGTRRLLDSTKDPDVIHCFNLHGDYFDLRALVWLSSQVPVVLDLRDAWLLSGHCAHSLDCERWKTGCGRCPHLTIYPAVRRDATAHNWRVKERIYSNSRVYVTTPSNWLMDKVWQSMLAPAVAGAKIIPTGVDLSIYRPAEKRAARAELGLPADVKLLLFAANRLRHNVWKDHETLLAAIARVAERMPAERILFIGLGEAAPAEQVGTVQIRFIGHQTSAEKVARYYQAADLYVHAARADTFPRVVIEALACATPVVATAVGGIPEQIRSLALERQAEVTPWKSYAAERATGALTPPGDQTAMATAIERLLRDTALRRQLGQNAFRDARDRFSLDTQVDRYLAWYEEILADSKRSARHVEL